MYQEREDSAALNDSRGRRVLLGRRLYGFGGLVLACCFFLPAVKGCNSPHIPAEDVWEGIMSGEIWDVHSLPLVFLVYISSYLLGLLTLMIAIRRAREDVVVESRVGQSVLVLMFFVCFSLIYAAFWQDGPFGSGSPTRWLELIVCLMSLVYLIQSCRRGVWGLIFIRLYATALSLAWFSHFLVDDSGSTLYGLWLSELGGVAIFVGTVIEAMGLYCVGALTILKKALICSRPPPTPDTPYCRGCGYLLFGLTAPRCPECGFPFDHPVPGAESTPSLR